MQTQGHFVVQVGTGSILTTQPRKKARHIVSRTEYFTSAYVQLARIQSHTHLTSKEAGKHSLLSAQEK